MARAQARAQAHKVAQEQKYFKKYSCEKKDEGQNLMREIKGNGGKTLKSEISVMSGFGASETPPQSPAKKWRNQKFRKIGLKRIFLDSCILKFNYKGEHFFEKELSDDLQLVVNALKNAL